MLTSVKKQKKKNTFLCFKEKSINMMDLGLSDLDEVLPLLLAGADGLFNAAELAEDGLCFI